MGIDAFSSLLNLIEMSHVPFFFYVKGDGQMMENIWLSHHHMQFFLISHGYSYPAVENRVQVKTIKFVHI